MLLVLFGPPAVGKMSVGRALCAISDFRLFHNHMTIEPLHETFGYGTPSFELLNSEFWRLVFDEARRSDTDLVFPFVWGLDQPADTAYMRRIVDNFDGDVAFVELRAARDIRLARNRTEARPADKQSKRDLEWSDSDVGDLEQDLMTTRVPTLADELLAAHPHLVVDTTHLTPEEVASQIAAWLPQHRRLVTARWVAMRDEQVPDEVARLLGTVPEWFGRDDSNAEYVDDARFKETWTVRDAAGSVLGVTLVERHFPQVAEIHLTVVDRAHHGTGVGTAMMAAIETDARQRGVRLLEVKTLGASDPDAGYARTRHFYEKVGFSALEETELWGPETPCLIMVKPLP